MVRALAVDVLNPAATVGKAVSPDHLITDGRVDVQLLRKEEPALADIAGKAARIDADAQAITDPTFVSALGDARSQLQRQTSDIAKLRNNIPWRLVSCRR